MSEDSIGDKIDYAGIFIYDFEPSTIRSAFGFCFCWFRETVDCNWRQLYQSLIHFSGLPGISLILSKFHNTKQKYKTTCTFVYVPYLKKRRNFIDFNLILSFIFENSNLFKKAI